MQFEKQFSAVFAYTANDATYHPITGFPAVAANTAVLVTGVYFHNSAAFGSSRVTLQNNDATKTYYNGDGDNINTAPIINYDNQFVMLPGDTLSYLFRNIGISGNLSVTIFYKVIPLQNLENTIVFQSSSGLSPTGAILNNASNFVYFIKSLIINNADLTPQTFTLAGAQSMKTTTITNSSTSNLIGSSNPPLLTNSDHLFLTPGNSFEIITAAVSWEYTISYYYDPLYLST